MKKKCLALLLALVMHLGLAPTAFAVDEPEIKWLDGMVPMAYIEETDQIIAEIGSKFFLLDGQGNVIKSLGETGYNPMGEFSDGLAMVVCVKGVDNLTAKRGFADTTGKIVIPAEYNDAYGFSEGLAAVQVGDYDTGKWGFIDRTGETVIPFMYDRAESFSQGLAAVRLGDWQDGKWGFIDQTGKTVIPFEYDEAESFSEGLALVTKDGKHGYIDQNGQVVIPFKYESVCKSFSDGRAAVSTDDSVSYIDKAGNVIFSYSHAEAGRFGLNIYSFSEGLVEISAAGDEYTDYHPTDFITRFVNVNGQVVLELERGTWGYSDGFHNGLMAVYSDSGIGLIDRTGNYVVKPSTQYWGFGSIGPYTTVLAAYHGFGIVQGIGAPRLSFTDLKPDGYYLDAVAWALSKNITTGTTDTTFSPNQNCTHAQILTFLWRAAGEPESSAQPPISMKGNEFYYKAVKWAAEKGMIDKNFNPKADCTRADAVNYIWQAAGKGAASYNGRFTDVPTNSPYATAAAWALEKGITTGTSATTFNPNGICNRGQIVTFLYRAYK